MEKLDRISGLDKLLELLTEHCRMYYGFKEKDDIKIDNDSCNFHLYLKGVRCFPIQPERLIFKHFLFIKRLVDNDKIDRKKIEKNQFYLSCLALLIDRGYYEKVLLMLLSIQDEPISFLVSILK